MDRVAELASELQDLFIQRGWKLACAESCTSGRLSAALTLKPGASAFFLGTAVTYSDSAKSALLHVAAETLCEHGAVSKEVVREMAAGARKVFSSDWAVSISGVAGPDGGTAEKPVGLVWFAVNGPDLEWQGQEVFSVSGRESIMAAAVEFALKTLLGFAKEKK